MVPVAGGGALANWIISIILLALYMQTFNGSAHNHDGELVFQNFSLMAKSASCLKQFFTACDAIQTEGTEVFGFVCLVGFFLLSSVITTHLDVSRKSWPRTKIVGMATLTAAGVLLLCRGMVIPQDHAWHTIALPTIIIFTVSAEAGLLIHTQIKEDGGSNHLARDLLMKLADTSISIYRCAHLIRQTRSPLDAEKILRLVGSGLPVLIGACQVGWIVYKAGFVREVVEWLRKIPRVFAGEEEDDARAAVVGDADGDAAEKVPEGGVEVVVVEAATAAVMAAGPRLQL